MITEECRNCEMWLEKDIIYAVGVCKNKTLSSLIFVYGVDYAADESIYKKISDTIKNGIEQIGNVELAETVELGRVNKVDPLGITSLRVRGMWCIKNPLKVFSNHYLPDNKKIFNFMSIINLNKWNTFANHNDLIELSKIDQRVKIQDIKIIDPNNTAKKKEAKLITFSF